MTIEIRSTPKRRWIWPATGALCLIAVLGAIALTRASTDVEFSTVKVADVDLSVPGRATLVPTETRNLISESGGTVTAVKVIAGRAVVAGDVLVQLANPEVDLAELRAEQALAAVRADHEALTLRLSTDRQQRVLAAVRAEHGHHIAELQYNAQKALREKGVSSAIDVERANADLAQKRAELEFETARVKEGDRSDAAQLQASQLRVNVATGDREIATARRAALTVTSPIAGVLRAVSVQPGQSTSPGASVAEVISTGFEVSIAVTDGASRAVREGQPVLIQGRGLRLRANTVAVAASADQGMVDVRAHLVDVVPEGIKAQTTFNATIQVGRVAQALVVDRPPGAREGEAGFVYRVDERAGVATRTAVQFGAAANEQIVVASGLRLGDRIALIDDTAASVTL